MSKLRVVERRNSGAAVARTQMVGADLPIPILERQIDLVTESAEDVERQGQRLHALADRLLGIEGAQGKEGEPIPSPSHAVGRLNDAQERLALARSSLNLAVNRLEAL